MLQVNNLSGFGDGRAFTPLDIYAVAGDSPETVADFPADFFRTGGTTTTFDSMFTYTGASLATTVDSAGNIVWKLHNLLLNTATMSTQNVTTTAQQYTLGFEGTGSVTLTGTSTSGPLTGSGASTLVTLNFTPTAGTLTLTVSGTVSKARLYRSDLGGMEDHPDNTGNDLSYLPATGSAVYGPRRHHHIYNGSSWVDQGMGIESEARTNLLTYSDDLTNAIYTKTNMTTAMTQTGADGAANSATLLTASAANGTCIVTGITSSSAKHVYSAWVKRVTGSGAIEITLDNGTTWEDVTSSIITGEYTQVATAFQTIADPDVGFRIVTSGDEIAVQFSQAEVGSVGSTPIPTSGSTVTRTAETLTIAGADMAANTTAMSFHVKGTMNYADEGSSDNGKLLRWFFDSSNFIDWRLNTSFSRTGQIQFYQRSSSSGQDAISSGLSVYAPGPAVAFNIASRNGSTFMNGAIDGAALTENTSMTDIYDFSSTTFELGYDSMGTIDTFRQWGKDIADSGIATAST